MATASSAPAPRPRRRAPAALRLQRRRDRRADCAAEHAPVRKDARVTAAPIELEPLLAVVRERSAFTGSRAHGERHWRTVGANGLWLAESLGAGDTHVIFLFALLHDSMRENEHRDPEHGPRRRRSRSSSMSPGCWASPMRSWNCSRTRARNMRTASSRAIPPSRHVGRRPARPPASGRRATARPLLHRASAHGRYRPGSPPSWIDLVSRVHHF